MFPETDIKVPHSEQSQSGRHGNPFMTRERIEMILKQTDWCLVSVPVGPSLLRLFTALHRRPLLRALTGQLLTHTHLAEQWSACVKLSTDDPPGVCYSC